MTMTTTIKVTMTMTKIPNVKVVIKLEYEIIVWKFAQDEAKATQRLPTNVESMFRWTDVHISFPFLES